MISHSPSAVSTSVREASSLPLRVSYAEMEERFEKEIFGGRQPKRALEGVMEDLEREGLWLETGVRFMKERDTLRGIRIQKMTIS